MSDDRIEVFLEGVRAGWYEATNGKWGLLSDEDLKRIVDEWYEDPNSP